MANNGIVSDSGQAIAFDRNQLRQLADSHNHIRPFVLSNFTWNINDGQFQLGTQQALQLKSDFHKWTLPCHIDLEPGIEGYSLTVREKSLDRTHTFLEQLEPNWEESEAFSRADVLVRHHVLRQLLALAYTTTIYNGNYAVRIERHRGRLFLRHVEPECENEVYGMSEEYVRSQYYSVESWVKHLCTSQTEPIPTLARRPRILSQIDLPPVEPMGKSFRILYSASLDCVGRDGRLCKVRLFNRADRLKCNHIMAISTILFATDMWVVGYTSKDQPNILHKVESYTRDNMLISGATFRPVWFGHKVPPDRAHLQFPIGAGFRLLAHILDTAHTILERQPDGTPLIIQFEGRDGNFHVYKSPNDRVDIAEFFSNANSALPTQLHHKYYGQS